MLFPIHKKIIPISISSIQAEREREDEKELRQSVEDLIEIINHLRQEAELESEREKEARLKAQSERAQALVAKEFAVSKLNEKRRKIRRLERELAISETELTAADHERELLLNEIDRLNFEIQTPTQVLEYGSSSQESD